jgi:choline dehydrogenase
MEGLSIGVKVWDFALSPTRKVMAGIEYVLGRRGPLSQISTLAGILVRSDPRFDRPDLQMNIFLWSIEKRDATGIYPHKWPGFSISPVPAARVGRVSLKPRSAEPPRSSSSISRRRTTSTPCSTACVARKIDQAALKPIIAEVQPGRRDERRSADRGYAQARRLNLHP